MAGGGTRGTTGLIHLSPFTLQSCVERRETWDHGSHQDRHQDAPQLVSQPKATATGAAEGPGADSCCAPPKAVCSMPVLQGSNFGMFSSCRKVHRSTPYMFALK